MATPAPPSGLSRRLVSFWPLQIGGWTLYALAIAVNLIPIGRITVDVIAVMAEIAWSFVASFAMHVLCRWLWRRQVPLFRALFYCAIACYPLGVACVMGTGVVEMRRSHQPVVLHWSIALTGASSVCVVLLAWSVLYFGIKHYLNASHQQARMLASEASARDAQLLALHYQLQPHFLFNTLNAISTLVVSRQPEKATEMIARLAGLLRNTLSFPDAHTVTLREELAVVEEYLSIERVRFGDRLRVSIAVSEQRARHRSRDSCCNRWWKMRSATRSRGVRKAARSRSGPASPTPACRSRSPTTPVLTRRPRRSLVHGVGLANTRARLEQLYGTGNASLTVSEQAGRFGVLLQLPLILDPIARGSVAAA